jgi:hypothetical protein
MTRFRSSLAVEAGHAEESPIFERAHDERIGISAQAFLHFLDQQRLMLFDRRTERGGIALERFEPQPRPLIGIVGSQEAYVHE